MTKQTKTEPDTVVSLGEGMLSWPRLERVGDRYGTVILLAEREGDPTLEDYTREDEFVTDFLDAPEGAKGTLKARVIRNRASGHLGDLFHGFAPPGEGAKPGTMHTLGSGELFREDEHGAAIGVIPQAEADFEVPEGMDSGPDRNVFWLDPEALYRLHEQTVELLFEVEA